MHHQTKNAHACDPCRGAPLTEDHCKTSLRSTQSWRCTFHGIHDLVRRCNEASTLHPQRIPRPEGMGKRTARSSSLPLAVLHPRNNAKTLRLAFPGIPSPLSWEANQGPRESSLAHHRPSCIASSATPATDPPSATHAPVGEDNSPEE